MQALEHAAQQAQLQREQEQLEQKRLALEQQREQLEKQQRDEMERKQRENQIEQEKAMLYEHQNADESAPDGFTGLTHSSAVESDYVHMLESALAAEREARKREASAAAAQIAETELHRCVW